MQSVPVMVPASVAIGVACASFVPASSVPEVALAVGIMFTAAALLRYKSQRDDDLFVEQLLNQSRHKRQHLRDMPPKMAINGTSSSQEYQAECFVNNKDTNLYREDQNQSDNDASDAPSVTSTESDQNEVSLEERLIFERRRLSAIKTRASVKSTAHYLRFETVQSEEIRFALRNSKRRSMSILELMIKDQKPRRMKHIYLDRAASAVYDGKKTFNIPTSDFAEVERSLNLLCKVASVPLNCKRR
jgi:hypothetical protein